MPCSRMVSGSAKSTARGVAMVEAFQQKAVVSWSKDFWSDPAPGLVMLAGYEVKETTLAG